MVSDIAMIGAVVVSAMGAVFGLYQARKADRSASTTKTIEIGVKDLVDQYQEANKELREETRNCAERCKALEQELLSLRIKVEQLDVVVDNKNAEIIRLRRKLGESFT